jgi:hypothetical protein
MGPSSAEDFDDRCVGSLRVDPCGGIPLVCWPARNRMCCARPTDPRGFVDPCSRHSQLLCRNLDTIFLHYRSVDSIDSGCSRFKSRHDWAGRLVHRCSVIRQKTHRKSGILKYWNPTKVGRDNTPILELELPTICRCPRVFFSCKLSAC